MIGLGGLTSRPSRVPTRMLADAVALLGTSAVVVGLSRSQQMQQLLPLPVTGRVAAVACAVIATGIAVQAAMAARLDGDRRARWTGAAIVVYTFVVVPLGAFTLLPDDPGAQTGARLVACLVTVGLGAMTLRPPPRIGAAGIWGAAAGGAVLTVVLLQAPSTARLLGTGPVALAITGLVVVVGTAVSAAILVDGYRQVSRPWWRVGLGLMTVALVQLYGIGPGVPAANVVLAVDGLQIVGLLAVVAGFGQLSVRALAELRSEQSAQQEELLIAVVHMERASELAAERDHELRNGLAGLAGITHLLSLDEAGLEHERLRHAVLEELGRLGTILDSGRAVGHESRDVDYRVEPVLSGLAILRRSAGRQVEADIDPDLRVVGDPAVLAQIVTSLLANCERHAPGARVTLRAHRKGGSAVVEVRDEGPGLAADVEAVVLERGAHDVAGGGTGLGLYISRRLVEREGGSLWVENVDEPAGCLAVVTVPRAHGGS